MSRPSGCAPGIFILKTQLGCAHEGQGTAVSQQRREVPSKVEMASLHSKRRPGVAPAVGMEKGGGEGSGSPGLWVHPVWIVFIGASAVRTLTCFLLPTCDDVGSITTHLGFGGS